VDTGGNRPIEEKGGLNNVSGFTESIGSFE
jgi:hypothetical protein